jgi:hypothetical protein
MLATLLRGPSFTLAVASSFRVVALHIVALAIATTSSRIAAKATEPQQWRVRAALEAVALVRLLDTTPQALRCGMGAHLLGHPTKLGKTQPDMIPDGQPTLPKTLMQASSIVIGVLGSFCSESLPVQHIQRPVGWR